MSDPYLTEWDPTEYLRQYYATPHVPEDERANVVFAARQLARAGRRYAQAVEVGCGPTLHHAMMLAPHVDRLSLADYLPANLDEARRALAGEPGAHNWEVYLAGMQGAGANTSLELLRERVGDFLPADVACPRPVGDAGPFDLVASYYCVECSTGDRDEWRRRLANLATLVAPGGALLLSALRGCRAYHVLGRTFPTAPVDERDFADVLPALGFDPSATVIEVVPVAEWAGQGFDGICCVWAEKPADRW